MNTGLSKRIHVYGVQELLTSLLWWLVHIRWFTWKWKHLGKLYLCIRYIHCI